MSGYADALERDLQWREAELASLKRLAISSRENPVAYSGTLRALWTMLYAHYEGFTKFGWDLVLDEIQRQKIKTCDLRDCVATLALASVFSELRGNTSGGNLWHMFQVRLPAQLLVDAEFPEERRISTKSNLWPGVFKEGNEQLGLNCTGLDVHEVRLRALVDRRNKIAHGDVMLVKSLEEYRPYEEAVLLLMHEFALCCLDYAEKGLYRRT